MAPFPPRRSVQSQPQSSWFDRLLSRRRRGSIRRFATLSTTVALVAGSISVGGAVVGPGAASAAAPFVCTGGTIYTTGFYDSTGTSGFQSEIYALNPVTGQLTLASAAPSPLAGQFQLGNALAITKGGGAAYIATEDDAASGATNGLIERYDTASGTWTTFPATYNTTNLVAGAINPATGIYYFATYNGGAGSDAIVYAFNTNTNTYIGQVADIPLNLQIANGDFAFDSQGDLYIIA